MSFGGFSTVLTYAFNLYFFSSHARARARARAYLVVIEASPHYRFPGYLY
jgi:hypothetical protein